MTLNPGSLTLAPGQSARVSVTADAGGASVPNLKVSVTNVPDGLGVTTGSGSVTVTAQAGSYNVPVTASATGGSGTADLGLSVSALGSAAPYAVTFNLNPVVVAAGSAVNVSVTGNSGNAALSPVRVVSVTSSLPTTVSGGGLGFSVQPPAGQTPGAYTLIVTTSSGAITQNDVLSAAVTVPSP
ncbi:hypothetical protein DESA109040_22355 [Deinococcus saxicola]|uniref:hypothetical protein n=1 Tax=Deinococcus saxicola TaxID=249406 RepID=UPI0039EF1B40